MNRTAALETLHRKLDSMAENMGPPPPMDPDAAMRRTHTAAEEFRSTRTMIETAARAGKPVSRADLDRLRRLRLMALLAASEYRLAVDGNLERL
jgi:hypothetical protein